MNKVNLSVNGRIYGGWKAASIKRSLKALSGVFNLSITDRWSGQEQRWAIAPGDECELKIDADVVITGFVDSVTSSMEPGSRSIDVSGRDKTADFVDCAPDIPGSEMKNLKLDKIASILAKPFGIKIQIQGDGGDLFANFTFQQGETAFEALERAARQRGFLLTTDGRGTILILKPGSDQATTALIEGVNILSGSATFDFSERFSDYIVKGHKPDPLASSINESVFQAKGTAKDSGMTRFRPLVIINEQAASTKDAKTRAEWEATVRAAKSGRFKISVQGWRQKDSTLWKPNQLVRVVSPWLGLDSDLLLSSVELSLTSEGGSVAALELERPDAYKTEPVLPKEKNALAAAIKAQVGG